MRRAVVKDILDRLAKPPSLLQVVVGPRQVGKTTAARGVGQALLEPLLLLVLRGVEEHLLRRSAIMKETRESFPVTPERPVARRLALTA